MSLIQNRTDGDEKQEQGIVVAILIHGGFTIDPPTIIERRPVENDLIFWQKHKHFV
jgi:hypothetical protein